MALLTGKGDSRLLEGLQITTCGNQASPRDCGAATAWHLLSTAVIAALPSEVAAQLRLIPCDRDHGGAFVSLAGFSIARSWLWADYFRAEGCRAVVVIGIRPIQKRAETGLIGDLFQWPGIAYLPYGFTREQLISTARQVIEGAKSPLPPGLLPTVADVLRITAEVRHWLENRMRNTEGALGDFHRASQGEVQLHRTHLDPVAPISDEHQAMLNRLWALEAPAEWFAPLIGGLKPLQLAIAEFETHWQVLEATRATLRANPDGAGQMEHLTEAVAAFKRVRDTLSAAIKATRELDQELTARKEN